MNARIRHSFLLPNEPHFVRAILGISPQSSPLDPLIDVFLAPIPPHRGPSVVQTIPVGELIDLHAGAVIIDGVVAGDYMLDRYDLELHFSEGNPVRARSELGYDLIGCDDVRHSAQFLEVPIADGRIAFVSMSEIFRFYYLSSSTLARSLLSDDILEPERTLYAPRHTQASDEDGVAHLVLRRGMLKSDVLLIARLVLSPSQIGLTRARGIYLFCRDGRSKPSRRLGARPPFEGLTQVACRGITLGNGPGAPLLITRLDSCSRPFPFKSLAWRYEDDYKDQPSNGTLVDARRPGKGQGRKIGISSSGFLYLDEGELPSTSFVSQSVEVESFADRFPDVSSISIERTKLDAPDGQRSRTRSVVHDEPLNLSAHRASSRPDPKRKTQAVDPTSVHDVDGEGAALEDHPDTHLDVLEQTIDLANQIALVAGAQMTDRVVTAAFAESLGHVFNLFPSTVEARKRRWLYLDRERTLSRPLLIVEFEACGRFGYLADIVRRGAEKMSLMLLRSRGGAKATDEQLNILINLTARARVRGMQTSVSELRSHGIELSHHRHRLSEDLSQQASNYCQVLQLLT